MILRLLFSVLFMTTALAAQEARPFDYQIDGASYEGAIARPTNLSGPTPAVLIVHDWKGFGPFAKERAEQVAKLGYIAFAVDLYGKGIMAKDPAEAGKLSGPFYKNPDLFRSRMKAALAELLKQPNVDPKRVACMGFCFGGSATLELVRSGAELAGAVTFHGGLKTAAPAQPGVVRTPELLILHGAIDPTVPPSDVAAFMEEMNKADVPYRLVAYPKTVHAFTNPEAGSDITKPTAYNPEAAKAAYGEMETFFARIFSK